MDKHYLTPLFSPNSIVVFVGKADEPDSQTHYGRAVSALIRESGFAGPVTFLDVGMTGTLGELAHSRADLAVIALPDDELPSALEVAGRIQCQAALIISTGVDQAHAKDLHAIARKHGIQLLGPNCLGYQRPRLNINVGVVGPLAQQGPLALVSQSGALTSSILDWADKNAVGFSTVVSLGPNTAVDLAQTLDFLATDPATHSIVIYMEGITNARRFLSALRAAAITKPVVVLKAGRKAAASQAALTHSGNIIGSDEVFDAALRRAGAVRVRSFAQLFSAAKCLASRYRPVGSRLAIVTNGGGPGVLAVDWLTELGLVLARLSPDTSAALAPQLPRLATIANLLDLSEEAGPQHYRAAAAACAADSEVDGILVIYSPKLGVDPTAVAQELVLASANIGKPLLTCWMGDQKVAEAREIINGAGIATFRSPEAAVDAFSNIASFYQNQQLLQQTPPPLSQLAKPDLAGAHILIESVLAERRKVLTEMESKALLAAFHIPITQTILAHNANEAMLIASQIGYPVALKIDSPDIAHKSDVQGVVLNVLNATSVRDIYNDMIATVRRLRPDARINGVTIQKMSGKKHGRELYIGVVTDQPFGPVITFGAGGTMIELINDRAVELPPLNQFLSQRLIQRVRSAETLGEWRGAPAVRSEAIEHVLLRVSEMVCALPQLREMDINPLIVDEAGALAVDARVVIDNAQPLLHSYDHLSILPYPSSYTQEWPMRGGGQYTLRPIQPDDAEMLQAFVRKLSDRSRYYRFVSSLRELSVPMLARYTLIDYDREMALVAVCKERTATDDGEFTETERMIGVSRYIANPDLTSCEFSLVVDDDFSGQGLGSRLMLSIMEVARHKGLSEIDGLVLVKNTNMLKLMKNLGFHVQTYAEDPDFKLCSKTL
ncbi:acyl-CoA synthetase (NDP forming) [Burkholderia sp. Ch1-1]|uniref:Putative Acetyl-CoA synthetase (ADP-forming) alpha and beta chains n=1 Tax=Paraburkholderia dioscoreae TaxID=2604047 RepID=A0A5Q4ZKR6_9BURK|nr:bifunctional acetate--CoA ligase family protein/GNAT family N-acetyltransferase [Paraburkholderia dioscoreae]EIF33969.1 acyl-CoA synthetase (NDP forming) [Burkholderia sp. Ch1-1]VVD32881.1 putative Acetyl-CoA synthetase (ADP-forming) alpha and beta chains [Paraburkholderia dioscoreae]